MKTIYVKLFGGEQDGYDCELNIDQRWPDMFYVHRVSDDKRIQDAKDPELKEILANSLAVLAYEFKKADPKESVPGGKQFEYHRCERADRSLKDPAC